MSYQAFITNKSLANGLLTVELEYRDGDRVVKDKMQSRSGQDADWIVKECARRVAELDGLETLAASIAPAMVKPFPGLQPEESNMERALYLQRLNEFRKFQEVLRHGFSDETSAEYLALKKWLTDNFKPGYLDLF